MFNRSNPSPDETLSGVLASAILIVTFAGILWILTGTMRNDAQPQSAPPPTVVAVVPTATAQPSSTPMPPTATVAPTNTPLPTNTPPSTPTLVPSALPASPPPAEMAQGSTSASISYDPALVAEGQELFVLCAACHGPDARGIVNLGKDLVASEFVAGLTDDALLEFIRTGRPIWDPLNTSGVDMPGKGGNPAMTDDDIVAIIAYVRSLSAER